MVSISCRCLRDDQVAFFSQLFTSRSTSLLKQTAHLAYGLEMRGAPHILVNFLVFALVLFTRHVNAAEPDTATPSKDSATPVSESCDPRVPHAAADARRVADEFFTRGKQLGERGLIANACRCFDASNELAPGRGGTLLNLGLCHEAMGKYAAAYRELTLALAKAKLDKRADRESLAETHLAALRERFGWLSVTPPSKAPDGLMVTLDGETIERADWRDFPTGPGAHTLRATAPGYAPEDVQVEVYAGQNVGIFLKEFRRVESPPGAGPAPVVDSAPFAPVSTPLQPSESRAASRTTDTATSNGAHSNDASPSALPTLRTTALITGIVGIAVSLGAGAWALERASVVEASCNAQRQCSDRGLDAAITGRTLLLVSDVGLLVGSLGLGTWALWPMLTAGSEPTAGVVVGGTF